MLLRLLFIVLLIPHGNEIRSQISGSDTLPTRESKISLLIDLFYSVDGFTNRLANALDNNPDYLYSYEDADFTESLQKNIKESAVVEYSTVIRATIENSFTDNQLDSIISVMESPYGRLIRNFHQLDNWNVENRIATYVNEIIENAYQDVSFQDSLKFTKEYPVDLRDIMNGTYLDTIFSGDIVEITKQDKTQTEVVNQAFTLEYGVKWLTNSKYQLYVKGDSYPDFGIDTTTVNVYEIDGNVFKYIVKFNNGSYQKSQISKISEPTHKEEAIRFQANLNKKYSNPESTPLKEDELILFNELGRHTFFAFDENLRIEADLIRADEKEVVGFKTSTSRIANYEIYGKARFTLYGKVVELNLYRSENADVSESHRRLFLPFRDLTSGEDTYGGGRYLDLHVAGNDETVTIDFNKSYQPYCAYTDGYSCPIPPEENFIPIEIKAGIKHLQLKEY